MFESAGPDLLYHIDSLAYHFLPIEGRKARRYTNIGMTPPSEDTMKEIGQLVMPGPLETKVQNPPQGGPFQQNGLFGGSDNLAARKSSFPLQVLQLAPGGAI